MRLISAEINGIGRLVDTKINLDSKIVAIVGPNEAGKTTLLKALTLMNTKELLPTKERSRARDIGDDDYVVTARYILDESDYDAINMYELDKLPKVLTIFRKTKGGSIYTRLEPQPIKPRAAVLKTVESVNKVLNHKNAQSYFIQETDGDKDPLISVETLISRATKYIESNTNENEEAASIIDGLTLSIDSIAATQKNQKLIGDINQLADWLRAENPDQAVRKILIDRTPSFIMFDEESRNLLSEYVLGSDLVNKTPLALKNLSLVAGLNLKDLNNFYEQGDTARRNNSLNDANVALEAIFAEAWTQSQLTVRLSIDGTVLRIEIYEDGVGITAFDERSAGFKMFVALTTFLKAQDYSNSVVLLIDEAENHLHIDAQADLVEMLAKQEQAKKVIYTTHSPACLPADLGTGVRLLVPNSIDKRTSSIKNCFWNTAAGYSPLMMAMGAGSAAFSVARCVVLAEGATEMILLPTLLRNATELENLPYQIAPGLSETAKRLYPDLDFVGARVAYCVDSDIGGKKLKDNLRAAGVPSDIILMTGVPGLENLLNPKNYVAALTVLLEETYPGTAIPRLPDLTKPTAESWALQCKRFILKNGLTPPSKVAVASWLIENGEAIPSKSGTAKLKSLHEGFIKALKI